MKMEADSSAELLAHQGNYQGAAKVSGPFGPPFLVILHGRDWTHRKILSTNVAIADELEKTMIERVRDIFLPTGTRRPKRNIQKQVHLELIVQEIGAWLRDP